MRTESITTTLHRVSQLSASKKRMITRLSVIVTLLAGCSNNQPAPISVISTPDREAATTRITPHQGDSVTSEPQVQALPVQTPLQTQTTASNRATTPSSPARPAVRPPAAAADNAENVQVRNGHIVYNRKYDNIQKGSYSGGSSYTVRHGDTLFYIAWITGNDYRDLAKRNNIPEPYSLKPGVILQVENPSGAPLTGENAISRADNTEVSATAKIPEKPASVVVPPPAIAYSENSSKQNDKKMLPTNRPATSPGNDSGPVTTLSWRWPATGEIIDNFSTTNPGNKGIDIAGKKGQAIIAAASGRVVYAGNALRGYGNLIILKHSDDFLSAYGHNDTMLVREQQEVKAGQQIATMGSTGTSSTRLRFEVRYKGKPVNPLRYLPQR